MIEIITSPIRLEIGKVITQDDVGLPFEDFDGVFYKKWRIFVINESNKEEYIEFYKKYYSEYSNDIILYSYFYAISRD